VGRHDRLSASATSSAMVSVSAWGAKALVPFGSFRDAPSDRASETAEATCDTLQDQEVV
jgi:hypothetical protein